MTQTKRLQQEQISTVDLGVLSTIGMRVRKSVSDGYQVPKPVSAIEKPVVDHCIQDNSVFTIPEYKRVTLGGAAPFLAAQRSTSASSWMSTGSNLEDWSCNVDQRLESIDQDMSRNKLGAQDLKRTFEDLDSAQW